MSQFARMTAKDEERDENLLAKANYLRDHMIALQDYQQRLRDFQEKGIFLRKGVEDELGVFGSTH